MFVVTATTRDSHIEYPHLRHADQHILIVELGLNHNITTGKENSRTCVNYHDIVPQSNYTCTVKNI